MTDETKKDLLQFFAIVLGFGGIAFAILFALSNDALGSVLSIIVAATGGVCGIFSVDDVE